MSKTEFDKRKGNELWFFCNDCQRDTYHKILTGVDYSYSLEVEDLGDVHVWDDCDIIQCGGCKDITFIKRSGNSEDYCQVDETVIQQFPPKEKKLKSYIKDDIYSLPPLLRNVYQECLKAIGNNSMTLAGIGLRAIIETLCKEKNVKGGNLEKRIDNLVTMGLLTPDGAEILHGIRLLGNDAAHDAKAPRKVQIDAAMKVVDHLILGIYIIPEEAAEALPKRQKKTTKKITQASVKPASGAAGAK